ncbi:alpha/beta hydrolase family protein [Formosa agariphila KMM 3901]|uniref:Alpha/beta hydrolase family protein n=1 Tax=Formosa agariphila (strain DSM 15362 / KCTC 12365 / LMG 23005 / KMM 3901 / M-2Alg 35-1) TaxID=1347342 RepID=T2KKN3_FORAG|nr:alpha/beta hydrolase [Formosa agariphila]CDF78574.1 alpha/beta hydrolase family protein [Formosa agariphila KMM 3901]
MSQDVIHVYFMPGMAANPSIFEYIKLPEDKFKIHLLEWIIPEPKESLSHYAKRVCEGVKAENPVLVGVSFGGILVQEMSKIIKTRKVVVISSVLTKYELPKRMKLARATKMYKFLPTHLVQDFEAYAKYTFGDTATKRVNLYKKYLSVRDKNYLDWAIEQVVCWEQEEPLPNTIHIHGEKDAVFPYQYINNCIPIKGGTHIMIINKYKWFNENLPKLILDTNVA